jgi:hypothetical protein
MGTPAREAATATVCLQKINISTAMAAFGNTTFTNFDEFKSFLDQIQSIIPSYAIAPFTSIMKVLFRKHEFLVNIGDVSRNERAFRCNVVFSYKKLFVGEIRFLAQKYMQRRKIRIPYPPYYERVFIPMKFIYVPITYEDNGGFKRKVLSFRSYPMAGKTPTRPHNQQPKYRRFMVSVISSMLMDNSKDATEYVMDQ